MNDLTLFLPCAAGVEDYLAQEVHELTGLQGADLRIVRAGVLVRTSWRDALRLNLHSRLAQRVLVQLSHTPYRHEQDLYDAAHAVAWELWFTPAQTFKVEVTAQHCPLKSLNFAALKVKDAVADRFRGRSGTRPSVDTRWPHIRLYLHLAAAEATLYIDTSGEPLFKRGWREDTGDAPLKETLAAAMLAASGWADGADAPVPLYDPCCGSGTIVIEAAQIACGIPAGWQRRFAFEHMLAFEPHVWQGIRQQAQQGMCLPAPGAPVLVYGSDVSHRMVDFAQRNAQRAGVAGAVQLRGGDALQRLPPTDAPGLIVMNPPYGERIAAAGVAGQGLRGSGRDLRAPAQAAQAVPRFGARELAQTQGDGGESFFSQLASHWKKHYSGWSAWVLSPDMKLPGLMRLKATRRVPLFNGPIECRLYRFDMQAGSVRAPRQPDADARTTG